MSAPDNNDSFFSPQKFSTSIKSSKENKKKAEASLKRWQTIERARQHVEN
jgi:hypothetical protein